VFGSLKGLMTVCQYEVHPRDTSTCCLMDNLMCSEAQTFLEMTVGVLLWFLKHPDFSAYLHNVCGWVTNADFLTSCTAYQLLLFGRHWYLCATFVCMVSNDK
jgi:hypothetical protein